MRALGLLLATAIVAGCTASTAGEPTGQGPARIQLDAEMIAYASGPGGPGEAHPAALRTEAEIEAFAGQFAAAIPDVAGDLATTLDEVDVSEEQVLIGAALGTGCFPPTEADLYLADDRHLEFEPTGPRRTGPVECVVQHTSVAVFAVPASQLPDDFTPQPTYAGIGRVVVHKQLSYDVVEPAAADVSVPGAFDDFVAALPDPPDVTLPATTDADLRTYAFVEFGCQDDTAELVVSERRVEAMLDTTEPDVIIACGQAVPYFIAMRVPADLIPEDAVAG